MTGQLPGAAAVAWGAWFVDMACEMSRGQSDFLSSFSWFSFSSDSEWPAE
jgi:hypothetical protein